MKLKPHELERHCKNPAPIYWICGDEPLLCNEACDQLIRLLKTDVTELIRLNVDSHFSDEQLTAHVFGMSLFAQEQLVIISLDEKWPARFPQLLLELLPELGVYCRIIIKGPRIASNQLQSKWYQSLDKQIAFVPIWPIDPNQLPQWLINRARQQYQINLHPSAAHLLADLTEGNLLASSQALEKLHMTGGVPEITTKHIEESLQDMAQFSVFSLSEAALSGDTGKALHVLQSLFEKQIENSVILWALSQEIRLLSRLLYQSKTTAMPALFKQYRIIERRKPAIQAGLKRLSSRYCESLLQDSATIDRQIKGVQAGDPKESLMKLVFKTSTS